MKESCLVHFKEMLEEAYAKKEQEEQHLVLDNKVWLLNFSSVFLFLLSDSVPPGQANVHAEGGCGSPGRLKALDFNLVCGWTLLGSPEGKNFVFG